MDTIGGKLQLALGNLNSLPAMPAIAHKLLALPLDTEEGEAQMLALIGQDPQLSARIVGLANSPAMGVGRKIAGVRDAAMLLGLKRLKSVAIGIATLSRLGNQPSRNFDPQDLWSHSMTIAIVMNALAREMPKRIRPDENQIFLAGLLHDIGLMVLHHLDPEASDELHRQVRLQPKRHIHDLELELLGMTHGRIGAQLARHWNLPEEIVEVMEQHHSLRAGDTTIANPLVRLVSVAEKLLPDFGIAEHTGDAPGEDEWRELCIDPARADELSALVNELALQVVQLPEASETSSAKAAETQRHAAPAAMAGTTGERSSMLRALFRWIGGLWR
jgi:putative nucleotidyltransferase with HDIG domain